MIRRSIVLTALAAAVPAWGAGRAQAELQCESFGDGPKLACTVRLRHADGTPLKDARVSLGAAMPSMPMAHSVRPVDAASTARPGEYRATLELEMTGVWAVQIDIAGPARDRIVAPLRIECEGDQRCPAKPATAAAGSKTRPSKP